MFKQWLLSILVDKRAKILITQDQLEMVATPSMNNTHLEAMLLINQLSKTIDTNNKEAINEVFSELIEHTQEHCKHEEELMVEKKFPKYLDHKQEHDDTLVEMQKVALEFKDTQNIEATKKYVDFTLAPWFVRHTETMDTVTSMFIENSETHLPYWEEMIY